MKKHILLIDKDKTELKFFTAAFSEMEQPVKCTYTECWRHATQVLEYLSVDAIFIHLEPDIADNLEFVRAIKRQKKFRYIPVVVFSENMPYYNFLSRGHGADHCLVKPMDGEMIKRTVYSMLAI